MVFLSQRLVISLLNNFIVILMHIILYHVYVCVTWELEKILDYRIGYAQILDIMIDIWL